MKPARQTISIPARRDAASISASKAALFSKLARVTTAEANSRVACRSEAGRFRIVGDDQRDLGRIILRPGGG